MSGRPFEFRPPKILAAQRTTASVRVCGLREGGDNPWSVNAQIEIQCMCRALAEKTPGQLQDVRRERGLGHLFNLTDKGQGTV